MPKIKLKRGLEANLPNLSVGEPGFTTDTKKLFVGSDTGNIQLAKQVDLAATTAIVTGMTQDVDAGLFTDTSEGVPIDGGGF